MRLSDSVSHGWSEHSGMRLCAFDILLIQWLLSDTFFGPDNTCMSVHTNQTEQLLSLGMQE